MFISGAAAIAASIISAVGAASAAGINYASQQSTNASNQAAVAKTNAQNQYNLEHAHQIEMADLKAAGLNPVLTATGGQGAPMTAMQAPHAQAPSLDLSGVSNALQSMTHMMMMSQLVDAKVDAAEKSADAKIQAANISAGSREHVADKYIAAGRARNLLANQSEGSRLIGNAKQIKKLKNDYDFNSYSDFMKWFSKKFKNR